MEYIELDQDFIIWSKDIDKNKKILFEFNNIMYNIIDNKILPDELSPNILDNFTLRDHYLNYMGFSILTNKFINSLSKFIGNKKCLEVMSGCGSLSYFLKKSGVKIIPTDNFTWKHDWFTYETFWLEIENIDAVSAIKKYGKDVDFIIMSWPYMDDTAYNVLIEMRNINPKCKLIYIGEEEGGCTANDQFFDISNFIDDENFSKVYDNFQQWYRIHDKPYLIK
jgi:hypothetical protein